MTEASASLAGNLSEDPRSATPRPRAGSPGAVLRVAASGRREQEASFYAVIVWRDQAEHAAESLSRGSRVMVVGRLQQRSWTDQDGSARSTEKVLAEELGRGVVGPRRHRAGRPGRLERYVIVARHRPCTPVDRAPY